ncbi:TlpA disulfide reductase family protein [Ohtaekwangia koreensis]|uniref:AhpC/TSA family protein n=1 Tax=Ohtaekwangia koreensis TaxID=688867 RepID=A0A1T5LF24_9BACT|nr:TlpA disulfide reductase family protein [Ohtaekwangia koreensis]SKC74601.1 AhpC/TSA family protein [Ohtaekwangia koreensis]
MKKTGAIIFIFFSFQHVAAQTAVVKFDRLEELMNSKSDKIQVINFWATWCAPCVKELPLFEKLNAEKKSNIQVTLVNLDFADKVKKVDAFLAKKNIESKVLLLDEIDYNAWIDKVDESWGGAIPATLVINPKNGKRKFIERELQEGELQKFLAEVE